MNLCDKNKCVGCAACYNICPQKAIYMMENEEGFLYPQINEDKCVGCGLCQKSCPIINSKELKKEIFAYACYNNDALEKEKSSSGGIFSLLAREIIKRGGVVFGAGFDEDYNVVHIGIEKEKELEKLRGSKYVQSSINDSYKKAKDFLEKDRYVLFTGTPCQIEGLNSFLGKDYDKLYTQDLICHGVPSPMIWNEYKKYRKNIDNKIPEKIDFRYKDNSWRNFKLYFKYKESSYAEEMRKDPYMRAFLRNVCLRDSCYNCGFKKMYRNSDITLGDFWGIEKLYPQFNNDEGISLVVLNSQKGKELFEIVKNQTTFLEVDFNKSIQKNSAFFKSVNQNKNRKKFYKSIKNNKDFKKIAEKYTKQESKYIIFLKKVYRKFKKILNNN